MAVMAVTAVMAVMAVIVPITQVIPCSGLRSRPLVSCYGHYGINSRHKTPALTLRQLAHNVDQSRVNLLIVAVRHRHGRVNVLR